MNIDIPNYAENLPLLEEKTPATVLREFASVLKKKTANMVNGSVFVMNTGGSNHSRYTFYLVVPELNNYTEPLFYVFHGAPPYPCTLIFPENGANIATVCSDLSSLVTTLEELFAGALTRQKIYTLMDMVKASR